jgi:hypothetical protein
MSYSLKTANQRRNQNTKPQPKYRTFVTLTPHFDFRPGDIIRIHAIPPQQGRYVAVDLPTGPEIAIYRKHYLQLSSGLQLVGLNHSILGVVFQCSR